MLNNNGIQFIEESHEYFLGDLKLRGISHLYGEKYRDWETQRAAWGKPPLP